jgi:type IX secretion system PorP/SprF family membrane protein
MKNYLLILNVFLLSTFVSWGQQTSLNSQYLFNDFAINPAVAGTKNYTPLSLSYRRQWIGIDEAPISQNLMAHTYIRDKAGGGIHFFNDASGPSKRTGISSTFAYHIKTGKKSLISFGLSGSLTQFSIDRDRLITDIPGDIAVNKNNNQIITDFNFGILYKGERHFIGVSGFNLLENKTNLFKTTTPIVNSLDRILYGTAGYNFKLGAEIDLQPSAVFRYMFNSPFQFDGNLKLTIKESFWIGGSYRMDDAISVMGGVELGSLIIGYAYDISNSAIKAYNDGTHEVFLCLKLSRDTKNKTPWRKRNRVYSNYTSGN